MSVTKNKFILGILATSMIAGCSVSQESSRNVSAVAADSGALLATAARPMAPKDVSPVKVNDGVFVGNKSVRNDNGDPLPSRFEGASGVTIVRTSPVGLREIAAAITEYTKIPVVLATPANAGETAGRPAPAASSDFAAGPIPEDFPMSEALSQISAAQPIQASSRQSSASETPINYTGPLSGLLDIVSAHFNVAWRYEQGRIVLDSVITRSFDVPALAVVSRMGFDLTSKSSSSIEGAETEAGQTASTEADSDVFAQLESALKGMVGDGSYSINKTTGTVTVTSNPATVSRVSEYISSMNQRLSEQVAISVKVYSVKLHDDEQFDLNVAAIFNEAGKYGVHLGTSAVSGGVVPSPAGGVGPGLGWALLDTDSKANGSNALVNALSTRGDVSVVTTASVTTVNGMPVPLQVGEVRDYIRQIQIEEDADGNKSYSPQAATVSTGFSLQITPRVERSGDILLQYGISISELTGANDGFETYSAPDGTTLQLKRVSQRNFIQQARIPNNNTLVLAGFEQVRNESVKRGVGRPSFPLFGGGGRSTMKREIIVITITPTLLKTN